MADEAGGSSPRGRSSESRRRFFRRAAMGAGAVVGGVVVLGIADADRGDDGNRPLYTRRFLPEMSPQPLAPMAARRAEGAGSRPTLVFLPGLGATTRYWEFVLSTDAGDGAPPSTFAGALLVDLLGFGRSPKPWTTYSVARHVEALRQVLRDQGPLVLVAHSLGARLAIAYAARFPEQVDRLVLVSLPFFGDGEHAKQFLRDRGASGWLYTHLIPMALVCLLSRRLMGWAFPLIAGDVPRAVSEDAVQMTWRSSTSTLWEVIYGHDLAADVDALPPALPILCLHGDADTSAPLWGVRALQPHHPASEVRVVAGGDHQLPLRNPAWLRTQIASQLSTGKSPMRGG